MIGRLDQNGHFEFPDCFELPARRRRWRDAVPTVAVWGLAIVLMVSLTASVMLSLHQALDRPAVPAQELIMGPGLGNTW